ncbi:MAG: (deoxy)nucleoside triphosphate pyrophosphohydrolase [Candidatus Methylomirabilota bacterium]
MIQVTAGILRDGERILICQRRAGGRFGLKWEFPGGTLEAGESLEACLRRELHEELGITAEIGALLHETEHHYPNGVAVHLVFFQVVRFEGAPVNQNFERMAWVRPEELPAYDFLEADRGLVDRLARGGVV